MGKQKLWLHAVGLLRHMERESLEPNVITYNSSISSCEKGQQWVAALELLRQMWQRRLEPVVITYLVHQFIREGPAVAGGAGNPSAEEARV